MQMKKNRTASSSLWETSNDWGSEFISNEHLASASFKWLPYLPEASECPFVTTILNDHPIMLVLVWQTIFVFKNTKDHKNVKNLDSVHWKFYNRKEQKKPRNKKRNETIKIQNIRKNVKFLEKKENKATSFVILAFLVYTFNINAMC